MSKSRMLQISEGELDNLTTRLHHLQNECEELTTAYDHAHSVVDSQQGVIEQLLIKVNDLEKLLHVAPKPNMTDAAADPPVKPPMMPHGGQDALDKERCQTGERIPDALRGSKRLFH